MHVHNLNGCAPAPLAHYLKALGILRVVAEQADRDARGWWDADRYRLLTNLSDDELLDFFLQRYEPTPIVSPWNKGSGFFYRNDPGISPIEKSEAPRLAQLRDAISAGRSLLKDLSEADEQVRSIKNEAKDRTLSRTQKDRLKKSDDYKARLAQAEKEFKERKGDYIPNARKQWRGLHREWMDAAMVLGPDGQPRFPALLGTGGNDGRLDFTSNFYQRVNDVFDLQDPNGKAKEAARPWFVGALWGAPAPGMKKTSIGQFLPGFVGGANNSNGPVGNSISNPVDFLLMLEGAMLFSAHATRRMDAKGGTRAAAPFAIASHGTGYASAALQDESARGEQWMPLWNRPLSLAELKRLFAEGRAQIGARTAHEPLDLARAVGRLGTARGIGSFQRYGFIERNGQSNLAVPLGRFIVPDHAGSHLSCLDDLDAWLPRLRRTTRDVHAPIRIKNAERRLSAEIFGLTQHPNDPLRWQSILGAMADIESIQVHGVGYQAGPIPRLRPEWIVAANDGSTEFRLAVAFALQAAGFVGSHAAPRDAIRRHWIPLRHHQPTRYATTGTGSQSRIQSDPGVVMTGRRGADDAIAVVERRLIEAAQVGTRRPGAPKRAQSLVTHIRSWSPHRGYGRHGSYAVHGQSTHGDRSPGMGVQRRYP